MNYSNYNLKEKAQIAAMINAMADKIKELSDRFHSLDSLGGGILAEMYRAKVEREFNEIIVPIAQKELSSLNIPEQLVKSTMLSPAVWKSMSGQGDIIEHMKKIFVIDLASNDKKKSWSFYAQLAIVNLFNVRLQ